MGYLLPHFYIQPQLVFYLILLKNNSKKFKYFIKNYKLTLFIYEMTF